MANGRDGRIGSGFSTNTFLLAPEFQQQLSTFSGIPQNLMSKRGMTENPTAPTGISSATKTAIHKMLTYDRPNLLDGKFGKGASQWILQNIDQFQPEEQIRLYYMMEQMSPEQYNLGKTQPEATSINKIAKDAGFKP